MSNTVIQRQIDLYEEVTNEIINNITPTLLEMKRIASEVFGEDKVQIQRADELNYLYSFREKELDRFDKNFIITELRYRPFLRLIIHFPEVTITNRDNKSHVIKNLFLGIGITKEAKINPTLKMIRSTFSIDEYNVTYTHSHVSGISYNWNSGEVCTGVGPINQSLQLNNVENFDEIEFRLLCYHIISLVKYESIEGTPYRYIKDVSNGNSNRVDRITNEVSSTIISSINKQLLIDLKHTPDLYNKLNLIIDENQIKVEPTEELELFIADLLKSYCDNKLFELNNDYLPYVLAAKRSLTYYQIPSINPERIPENYTVIKFKGVDYKLEVTESENQNQIKYYAHPDITKSICLLLSTSFTETGYKLNEVYK